MKFEIRNDRVPQTLAEMNALKQQCLTMLGQMAVDYAKTNITNVGAVDTGALRASVSAYPSNDEVLVGTNLNYGKFIEFGTGIGNVAGGTTKPSWVYFNKVDGKFHRAYPQPPRAWLKPAIANHTNEYKALIEKTFKGT